MLVYSLTPVSFASRRETGRGAILMTKDEKPESESPALVKPALNEKRPIAPDPLPGRAPSGAFFAALAAVAAMPGKGKK